MSTGGLLEPEWSPCIFFSKTDLFLQTFQRECPLLARGRCANELNPSEAAHPKGRQDVEVAQAHVLQFEFSRFYRYGAF